MSFIVIQVSLSKGGTRHLAVDINMRKGTLYATLVIMSNNFGKGKKYIFQFDFIFIWI